MINNKGFFTIPLVVFMLIFIGFTSYLFIISDKTSNYVHIGGTASNIFSVYQEAEKALFFIDKSAEYSVYKTLRNVNLDFKTNCGKKDNYILLVLGEQTCFFDENLFNNNFNSVFNNYLSDYTASYDKIDINNLIYTLEFSDYGVIGRSKELLVLNRSNITYSVEPSFKVKLDFNIKEVFLDTHNKIKEIYLSCKSDKTCWEDKKIEGIIVQDNGKLFIIEVDTGHRFGLYDEKLVLRFGLNFETNPLFR